MSLGVEHVIVLAFIKVKQQKLNIYMVEIIKDTASHFMVYILSLAA